jgi:dTDP-4-dehydrorhamnose reductase
MPKNPVLIAGKSGQLARCLQEAAVQCGASAVSIGRPELDFERGDNIERVVAMAKPSAIINAAAYTAVDRAEMESERAFAINCAGAAKLAAAAERRKIPFIHVSTDYVFNGSKKSAYREDDLTAPLNVYGASKLAGEGAVLSACPSAVIIRTSWVYSPYGNNFIRTMCRLSETQSHLRIVNDQHGAPTSALDLADAIWSILGQLQFADNNRGYAGIYHLTGNGKASWHDFAGAIFADLAARGHKVPRLQAVTTAEYPTPARRPLNSSLDSSKAELVFGVRLPPWQSSVTACLARMEIAKELSAC